MKPRWNKKPCGCVKTELSVGKAVIRCTRHRGKSSKRTLLYLDEAGIVRAEGQ